LKIKLMAKYFLQILFVLFFTSALPAQKSAYRIKYLSTEFVYIDAGKKQGIVAGDSLQVFRNKNTISSLKVVYTAGHSASCKIVSSTTNLKIGDLVIHHKKDLVEKDNKKKQRSRKRNFSKKQVKVNHKVISKISVGISVQGFWFKNDVDRNYELTQPSLRLKIRAKHLWNRKDLNFRLKFRTRYDTRSRQLNSGISQNEWRNRLYEASFSYSNSEAPLNFKLGRIFSNSFSGIGFIDGILVQHNLNSFWHWGIFGGTQPEWQYSSFQTSLQKYGVFLNFVNGDYGSKRFEATLSAAGVYHRSTISRELLYFRSNYTAGRRWSLYQSLELDINRGWRKEKSGENISVSGLYLNGRYNFSDQISTTLSYDSRKNYYIYEFRNIADSLFDAALRRGVRSNWNFRFSDDYRLFLNFGLRKRESRESYNTSFSGGIQKYNFILKNISLALRLSGFDNQVTKGMHPSLRMGKTFRSGQSVSASYGAYVYTFSTDDAQRMYQWFRLNTQLNLLVQFYLSADYQYNFGNDYNGQQVLINLGYRF